MFPPLHVVLSSTLRFVSFTQDVFLASWRRWSMGRSSLDNDLQLQVHIERLSLSAEPA